MLSNTARFRLNLPATPGSRPSCCAAPLRRRSLPKLPLASDRSYILIGQRELDNKPPAAIALADANFGPYPMPNGLTRLASRFLANPDDLTAVEQQRGKMIDAEAAQRLGLITF